MPNLVVAAFDSAIPLDVLAANAGEAHAITRELWGRFGRRLGSVLTDARGHFIFDDAILHGQPDHPNLLVVVFAPEDVTGVEHPFPLPPERRVLYVSSLPRREAGTEEAYVIRLLRAQLDRFALSATDAHSSAGADAEALQYFASYRRAIDFERAARRLTQPLERDRVAAVHERQERAERAGIRRLSALPLPKQKHPQRLQAQADLHWMLVEEMRAGITRMQPTEPLELLFSQSDLEQLGLQVVARGASRGEVDGALFASWLAARNGSVELRRRPRTDAVRDLLALAAKKRNVP